MLIRCLTQAKLGSAKQVYTLQPLARPLLEHPPVRVQLMPTLPHGSLTVRLGARRMTRSLLLCLSAPQAPPSNGAGEEAAVVVAGPHADRAPGTRCPTCANLYGSPNSDASHPPIRPSNGVAASRRRCWA